MRLADIDLVDALAPLGRRTVAAWLHHTSSTTTRRVRLQVLTSFLRWLRATESALDLLAVSGPCVDRYCDAARVGGLPIGAGTPGKPLASATVAKKQAALTSFYRFAWRCGALPTMRVADARVAEDCKIGGAGSLAREDRRLLHRGIPRLAADGRTMEAAAVALLIGTGASVETLASFTPQNIRTVTDTDDGVHMIIVFHTSRDGIVAFPMPSPADDLLRTLYRGRAAGEPILRRGDGEPVDFGWVSTALARTAIAGGMPEHRATQLNPRMFLEQQEVPE